MRSLSAACAALMVSVLVGVASPVSAAIISITDIVPGPVTVLSGPGNAFSYTHSISPPFDTATDTVLDGTLTIEVSNPNGAAGNFQVQFDAGTFINEGTIPTSPPSTSYVFLVDGTVYGTIDIRSELQTTGELDVTIRLIGGGAPGSESFIFEQSTLTVRADVAAVPEPASLLLLGSGLLGLAAVRRLRRRDAVA